MNRLSHVILSAVLLALLTALPAGVSAQTLLVTGVKTDVTTTPGDYVDAYGEVKNLTSTKLQVRLQRVKNDLPSSWSSSICFGEECYAPGVSDITVDLQPNATIILKLSFETSTTPGEGESEIVISNAASPSENHTLTFHVRTSGTSSTDRVAGARVLTLGQNYPNPLSLSDSRMMSIGFTNPRPAAISLRIYNLLGSEVRTLVNENRPAGTFVVTWDLRDNHGALLPAGIYIYKLGNGSQSVTRRMVISR